MVHPEQQQTKNMHVRDYVNTCVKAYEFRPEAMAGISAVQGTPPHLCGMDVCQTVWDYQINLGSGRRTISPAVHTQLLVYPLAC